MISQYNRFFSRSRSLYKPGYSPQLEFGTGSLAGTSRFVWSFQSRMIGPSFLMDHTLFVQLDLQSGRNKLRQAKKKTMKDNYRSRPPLRSLKRPIWLENIFAWVKLWGIYKETNGQKSKSSHRTLFLCFICNLWWNYLVWSLFLCIFNDVLLLILQITQLGFLRPKAPKA